MSSNVPANLKYAKSHEWVRAEGEVATVGITDHAQHELTDIVFVELPAVGRKVKAGEACAQRGVKNLCRGTVGWRRRGSERGSCSRPGRVLEKPSARTTEGPAMGKRLEPGADRQSPAGGLPGRRDHAHQP